MTAQDRSFPGLASAFEAHEAPARTLQPRDFMRLYEAYYTRVLHYVYFRCGDAHTSEDLTAQTFERALDRLDQYCAERAPFGAWLFAIARNLVSDYLHSRNRTACLPLESIGDQPDSDPTPEEHLIESELQAALLQAFETLSERERDILSFKFGARFTNRRIAALTGLSQANVGVIVYRAVQKLRLCLDGVNSEHDSA